MTVLAEILTHRKALDIETTTRVTELFIIRQDFLHNFSQHKTATASFKIETEELAVHC